MNFKKIASIVLSALVVSSQSPIHVDAMRSGLISPYTEVGSAEREKLAKSYALGLVNSIRHLSYSEKVSIPRFLSPEDAKKYIESISSQFTPTPRFGSLGVLQTYVLGLAQKIFNILKSSTTTKKLRDDLADEIYLIINEFYHIIDTLGDDISELPAYLSDLTKHDVGSMSMLAQTVDFPGCRGGIMDYSNPTEKITITPNLRKLLITYHLTMIFMNESFGKYLGVRVENDSRCEYSMCTSDQPVGVYHSVVIRFEGVVNRILKGEIEPVTTKWDLIGRIF